jgi:c-di-GMP-binding flagellar brake protein YcgR
MEKESDYLIRNPNLVLSHFRDIVKNRCIISAHFGEAKHSYLTSIIEIDPKKRLIELDCAPDESLNSELLACAKVLFRTEFDGIKVSFAGKNIKQIKKNGEKLFVMPIPDSIFWMQRRQCYRAKIPEKHTHCFTQFVVTTLYEDETGVHALPNLTRFKVVDISITGMAFLNVTPGLADYVLPPKEYQNCVLHLHDEQDTEARVSFRITNVNKIRSNRAIVAQRVGCQFTEIPPGFDAILQRYVQEIELQQRNVD